MHYYKVLEKFYMEKHLHENTMIAIVCLSTENMVAYYHIGLLLWMAHKKEEEEELNRQYE